MSIVTRLLSFLGAIRRFVSGSVPESEPATTRVTADAPARAPAVAGYVRRLPVDRFFLARRLASVARLNTPEGRIPWSATRRSTGLPPVPVTRLGAKKTRLGANKGLRVLPQIEARRSRTAQIIPFPASRTADHREQTGRKQAA